MAASRKAAALMAEMPMADGGWQMAEMPMADGGWQMAERRGQRADGRGGAGGCGHQRSRQQREALPSAQPPTRAAPPSAIRHPRARGVSPRAAAHCHQAQLPSAKRINVHLPFARAIELDEVDALPSTEGELGIAIRPGERTADQHREKVRVG